MLSRMAIMAALLCLALRAQTDKGALTGSVTDASGGLVPGVKVELNGIETGLHRETASGSAGNYEIAQIPVGTYTVSFTRDGFREFRIQNLVVSVGETRTQDVRLSTGMADQQMEVTADEGVLNRTSAEIGVVIEGEQVRDIPLNGRNWATLMTLAPGAINVGGGSQRDIRFFGRSRDDNNFTFDGNDASGVQEAPQKADARLNFSLESIAEFRVSSAVYTAESGAAGGAQVNVVSRSGTNAYHGSLFEFLRNDKLDARSPFDPATLPPFRLNQFGAELGGPVWKNKAFFFVNYEGLRQSLGQTLIGFVPSAAERARVIAASPALAPIVNAYPVGQTRTRSASVDQFTRQGNNSVREDYGFVRFDYRFSDATTMFARYNVDSAYIDRPNGAIGGRDTTSIAPHNAVLQLTHVFSPRLVNESKFGVNRSAFIHPVNGLFPITVSVNGYDDLSGNSLDEEVGTTISGIDNLTWTRGRHTFKFGVEIRRIRLNNSGNAVQTTSIAYADLPGFEKNSLDSIGINDAEGIRGLRRTFYMGYAQDEWKVTPGLTLNLGLRYEFYSVAHEVKDRAAVVDVVRCKGFCPPGTAFYQPNTKDFGPRVGLAWSPAALHGRTVIRSGFGLYYGANQNDDFSDPLESAISRSALSSADNASLSYPITPFLGQLQDQGQSPKAIDRYRKDLYYENWDFSIQQQLPGNFVGQANYVGSAGHHLFSKYVVNLIDPVTKKRPLPQFGQFGLKTNDGNSEFDALQMSLQRHFTAGWLWQTQYMWSHAITDASVGAGEAVAFQNQACRACDRSDSPYDVRHTVTLNSVYELPVGPGRRYWNSRGVGGALLGGWSLSGIETASTGRPVNITISRSSSALADGNKSGQRPDYLGGSIYPASGQSINNWFNPLAFGTPAKFAYGTAGRNIGRGPGYYELDLALEKRTKINERLTLNFRTEAFNLFNHPIYANPGSNLSSPATFGRITSVLNTGATGTGTPRRLQFMLRLNF